MSWNTLVSAGRNAWHARVSFNDMLLCLVVRSGQARQHERPDRELRMYHDVCLCCLLYLYLLQPSLTLC